MDTKHFADPEIFAPVNNRAGHGFAVKAERRLVPHFNKLGAVVKFFLVIGSLASLPAASALSQHHKGATSMNKGATSMNKVAGMWKPVTIEANLNGKKIEPFGPHPDGLLVFAENLHFVEVIQNPDVPPFASNDRLNGTAEENKAAVAGNLGLYGTYTVDSDGNFTGNHVDGSTFPNWKGNNRGPGQLTEVVEGDTMTETFHDGSDSVVSIVWQRVK